MTKGGPKGQRGENIVARVLSRLWPAAHRGNQKTGAGLTGAEASPDIEGTPLWAEVKWYKDQVKYSMYYRQTEESQAASGDTRPVAVIGKINYGKWMIHMALEDFIKLIEEERNYTEENEPESLDLHCPQDCGKVLPSINGVSGHLCIKHGMSREELRKVMIDAGMVKA